MIPSIDRIDTAIAIPTCGRAHSQPTLLQIPDTWRHYTHLFVQAREAEQYKENWPTTNFVVLPKNITTIAPTRDYIIQWCHDNLIPKVIMMDDDLLFFSRRQDDPTKFTPCETGTVRSMLAHLRVTLDKYAHAGICPREGGNRIQEDLYCTRVMRVLAYHVEVLMEIPEKFSDVVLQEDHHMNLSLLKRGYANTLLAGWCHNQAKGSGADGGCSHYRTIELHNKCVQELAKLHEEVTVVDKETKTAWGGQARKDTIIAWKKAAKKGGIEV